MNAIRISLALLLVLGCSARLPLGSSYALGASDPTREAELAAAQAASNAEAGFRLEWGVAQGLVQVSIYADRLEDLYAFEMKVHADPDKLRLAKADMPSPGFSLEPLVDGDELLLVYTKTGNVLGHSGSLKLATLSFERIGAGETTLSIPNVSVVDSKLNRLDLRPSATTLVPAHAGLLPFPDAAGHWAEKAVREAAGQGWVTGYEDGSFRPDRPVSRAELAALLVRAFGLPAGGGAPGFADAASIAPWARPHAAAVQAAGLIGGYEDGAFRPETPVSRAELAVVLARALEPALEPALGPAAAHREDEQPAGFADAADIPAWARPAAAYLAEAGLIRGKGGNLFAPLDAATRAEVCTLILRLSPSSNALLVSFFQVNFP